MKEKGNIYIAGPITGVKDWKRAFNKAATQLRSEGWFVMSPPEIEGETEREVMAAELEWLARCADAIYMLSGWEESLGAEIEWKLARKLSLKIFYED